MKSRKSIRQALMMPLTFVLIFSFSEASGAEGNERSPFTAGVQVLGAWNYDGESSSFGYPMFEMGYRRGAFGLRGRIFPIIATMGALDVSYMLFGNDSLEISATASYAFRAMYDYWSNSVWTGLEVGTGSGYTWQYYFFIAHGIVYYEDDPDEKERGNSVNFGYLALGGGIRF